MKTYALNELVLESPLINAAGTINGTETNGILRDVETLADTGIGAITVGSFTVLPRPGNAHEYGEPVSHYDSESGTMTNALGLPNIGIEAAAQLVPRILELAGDKPVIFSISPSTEPGIGDSVEQSVIMANRIFAAGAKIIELNVSCPNVVTEGGGRKPIMGYDVETMKYLTEALYDRSDPVLLDCLGIKPPPYIGQEQKSAQAEIAHILAEFWPSYLAVSNTIPGHVPLKPDGSPILRVPNGVGGRSGPSTKMIGRDQLSLWRRTAPEIPIISMLGVFDGLEVKEREQLGASVSAVNSRLWLSRNWKATVTEILNEYVAASP